MSDEKTTWPWEQHKVTPEAEALLARTASHDHIAREDKRDPIKVRHYLLIAVATVAVVALPLLIVSLVFDLPALLRF